MKNVMKKSGKKGGNMKRAFDTFMGFACLVLAIAILMVSICSCQPIDGYQDYYIWEQIGGKNAS